MDTEQLLDTASVLDDGRPERAAIVVCDALGTGHAANAAAVVALTLGARAPSLPGPAVIDGDGVAHPGLYPSGLPILRADAAALRDLHRRARDTDGVAVIALPALGQTTTDYDAFRDAVGEVPTAELQLGAVLVSGGAKAIRRLTGSFGLLR
jgi:hypothetical protein